MLSQKSQIIFPLKYSLNLLITLQSGAGQFDLTIQGPQRNLDCWSGIVMNQGALTLWSGITWSILHSVFKQIRNDRTLGWIVSLHISLFSSTCVVCCQRIWHKWHPSANMFTSYKQWAVKTRRLRWQQTQIWCSRRILLLRKKTHTHMYSQSR